MYEDVPLGDVLRIMVSTFENENTEDIDLIWTNTIARIRQYLGALLANVETYELVPLAEMGRKEYKQIFYISIPKKLKMNEDRYGAMLQIINNIINRWAKVRRVTTVTEAEHQPMKHKIKMKLIMTW
jgi:hypothetical protein